MMKDDFYFTLKVLFISKIFKFCPDHFVVQKNDLIRKIKLISKLMASQPGKQTMQYRYCSISQEVKGIRQ